MSDRQAALFDKSRRYVFLPLIPVLIVLRSNDEPPILAFGTCIALLILLSAGTLLTLLALQTKAAKSRGQPRNVIQNDLGLRILLAGLSAPVVVFFDIYDQAAPYAIAVAAVVALGMRLLQLGFNAKPSVVEAILGLGPLYDLALVLLLFIVTYTMFARPAEPQPSHVMITDWAVLYIAGLRVWQMRGSFDSRNKTTS